MSVFMENQKNSRVLGEHRPGRPYPRCGLRKGFPEKCCVNRHSRNGQLSVGPMWCELWGQQGGCIGTPEELRKGSQGESGRARLTVSHPGEAGGGQKNKT